MDVEVMARLLLTDPDVVGVEVFLDLFTFLWEYLTRAMYLPGQIVQWNAVLNMGQLSCHCLPRELVLGFGKFCGQHCLHHLGKSYYLRVSWGQRMFYAAAKWMIPPETVAKYVVTAEAQPQELLDQYHPCQLEKRFGGAAETPTRFWPPHVGTEFFPDGDTSHLGFIKRQDYENVLDKNPLLERHPAFLEEGQSSRDFIAGAAVEPETREPFTSEAIGTDNQRDFITEGGADAQGRPLTQPEERQWVLERCDSSSQAVYFGEMDQPSPR